MNYHFKIHKEKKGYWAECIEIPGCVTQGDNLDELKSHMKEALNLILDEPADSKILFNLPNLKIKEEKSMVKVEVDPHIAFAFLMRHYRLEHEMTQSQMKEKLQFKNLFSYQKLEISKYANPTLKSLMKIKKAFPDFPLQLLL
jgi:predicted RNase H-like HicB family nuclease